MNGKGSRARSPEVTRAQYQDNFDRIFGGDRVARQPDTRKWGYSRAGDARYWEPADAGTRDEVIAEAKAHYGTGRFAICRCQPIDVASHMPSGDDLCEQLAQTLYDEYGFDFDVFPDVDATANAELLGLVQRWAAKHLSDDEVGWVAVDIESFIIDEDGGVHWAGLKLAPKLPLR